MDQDRQKAKELVRALPLKQKIIYYLDNYKYHLIVALILIIGLVALVRTELARKEPLLYFGLINSTQIDSQKLTEQMCSRLSASDKQTVTVYTGLYTDPDQTVDAFNSMNLLAIHLAAGELNLVFSDETGISSLAASGACRSVNDWLPAEYEEEWGARIQMFPAPTSDSDAASMDAPADFPAALDLSGLAIMNELYLDDKTHYLAVINKEFPEDRLREFLAYMHGL